jgi:tetratricopeptide (TPR) repeat protein
MSSVAETDDDYTTSAAETEVFDKSPPPKWLRNVALAPSCGDAIKLLSSLTESPPDRPDAAPPSEHDVSDLVLFIRAELPRIRSKCAATLNPVVLATLTDDDYLYIMAYTAAKPYKLYNLVNAWVMTSRRSRAVEPIVGPFVKGLILALMKLDPVVVPGFRAIRVRSVPGLVRAFEQWETVLARGQPVNFWSFASFTTDPRILSDPAFCGGPSERAIIYQCEHLIGVDVGAFSVALRDEKEVLAIPPAMFQVVVCMQVPKTQKIVCTVRMIDNGAYEYTGASASERQRFADLVQRFMPQSSADSTQQPSSNTNRVAPNPSPASPPASPTASASIPLWVAALGVDDDLQRLIASLQFRNEDELAAATEKDLIDFGVAIGLRKRFFDFMAQRRGTQLEESRLVIRKRIDAAEQELEAARKARDDAVAAVAKTESELKAIEAQETATQNLYDAAVADHQKFTMEQSALDSTILQLRDRITQYTELASNLRRETTDIEASELTVRNRLTEAERQCEDCAIPRQVPWQKDSEVSSCTKCKSAFGLFKRKHHCRVCGLIFCDSCSATRVRPPGFSESIRVCESCALICFHAVKQENEKDSVAEELSQLQNDRIELTSQQADVDQEWSEAGQELEKAERRRAAIPSEIAAASAAVTSTRASSEAIRYAKGSLEAARTEQELNLEQLKRASSALIATVQQDRIALDQANLDCAVWEIETRGDKAALSTELWTALGNRASSSPLTIKGVQYSAERCFVAAIDDAAGKSNVTDLGKAWAGLASSLTPQSVVRVAGRVRTKRDCCMEALCLGETSAALWLALAETMLTPKETLLINTVRHTAMDCCLKAIELDSELGAAWAELAKGMWSAKVPMVTCRGQQFNVVQCCLEALHWNDTLSLAWNYLGNTMNATEQVQVNGVNCTKRQCYLEALKHDPKYSHAWHNLGIAMNATEQVPVNGMGYTQRQCYLEALKHHPKFSHAWHNLGNSLNATEQVQVNGVGYTKGQCYLEALKHDPTHSYAWYCLGIAMNATDQVQVNGVSYTQMQCLLEAVKHDPTFSLAWNNLGFRMSVNDHVQVNGFNYTQRQCYLEALKHDPTLSNAWNNLATTTNEDEAVQVNGVSYTERQCYLEALKHNPKNSNAWNNLGTSMNEDQCVQFNGVIYAERQCYLAALEHDPSHSDAWTNLGNTIINAFDRVQVNGVSYSDRECYFKALNLNPRNSRAWNSLGNTMNPLEQVQVNGVMYTQRQCNMEALRHR